jgi:hypothetical protein
LGVIRARLLKLVKATFMGESGSLPFLFVSHIARALTPKLFRFTEDNPGGQALTGSFNPTQHGEWYKHAYECPPGSDTEELENSDSDEADY